jgi:hypothetical protein
MIFNWINEEITPGYLKRDRMIMVLKSLSITTQRQIQIITGWSKTSIEDYIKSIRNMGNDQEAWLRAWKIESRGQKAYALGEKALRYAEELKNEFNPNKEYHAPFGQARHFIGTNEILCRAILAGHEVVTWYGQSDTLSQLYYKLSPYKSPVKPDATIKLKGGKTFFLEFDTGSESGGKIENRMHRYLDLQNIMESHENEMNVYPVIWVTYNEQRRAFLQRKWEEAKHSFGIKYRRTKNEQQKHSRPNRIPEMYFFNEGQETSFLAGEEGGKVVAI